MTILRNAVSLDDVDDEKLESLAMTWRTQALRGNREAFGIAHALEVEQRQRRRLEASSTRNASPPQRRPWWRFWESGNGASLSV